MIKKLFALLLIASLLGCEKKQEKVGCAPKECTLSFAMLGVNYTDKDGAAVFVKNFSVINQRTQLSVLPTTQQDMFVKGYYVITDDSKKDKFSTEGDNVIVSATYEATGQTKTATFKISGGCNCHINKISGPQTISFD